MRNTYLFLLFLIPVFSFAQNTSEEVYQILQNNCVSCHAGSSPEAGLDLEGVGVTTQDKMLDVLNTLLNGSVSNAYAAGQGYSFIVPGRPDRSFLFRKINQGLDPFYTLHADEGSQMPAYPEPELTDIEKEVIRQWINFGAPATGEVVSIPMLEEFYTNGGIKAFENGPPPAPDPSEGFQIKMGPFFLPPSGELEYFQKYQLHMDANKEVTRINNFFDGYSHHFIVYKFDDQASADAIPDGLRLESFHNNISLVEALQEPTDLMLPEGTAFSWESNTTIDLNSHYINYSPTMVYQAEVYANIYTQDQGTAAQEMLTMLIPNPSIFIPADEEEYTFTQSIAPNWGEIYIWGLVGHTHKYGTAYKIYERENASQGELLYDGACYFGNPNCASPVFDYQHIPMRYFEPLRPTSMTFLTGLIHEASYINTGTVPVQFGATSADEMMVMVMMFTQDTAGITYTDVAHIETPREDLKIFPNPASHSLTIELPELQKASLEIYDAMGRMVLVEPKINTILTTINIETLSKGMYFIKVMDENGKASTSKFYKE